jgi:hypothetical protein
MRSMVFTLRMQILVFGGEKNLLLFMGRTSFSPLMRRFEIIETCLTVTVDISAWLVSHGSLGSFPALFTANLLVTPKEF